ncbi:MAG: mechanosensitive ion channel domain-containing protein, partial [Mobilitalea sp.]
MNYISKILKHYNVLENNTRGYLSCVILIVVIILACVIINFIIKKIILRIIGKIMRKDKFQSTTILLERKVFEKMANVIPAIIIYMSAPAFNSMSVAVHRFASAYILIAILFVISALLEAVNDIYKTRPVSNVRPIKGLLQVIKIILVVIISIVLLANLMGENPTVLLGGIGALAVAFSFIFKDTILGFIAGIQLTSDDMLRIGDFIEMPKHGANGAVIDINLTTVKVQNPDKSIINIPAYALISDSFKNWRGMTDFGARRIRRIINIDVTSICFCTP